MEDTMIASFNPLTATVQDLNSKFSTLKVDDFENKDQVANLLTAKKEVKSFLTALEKTRKALNEDALAYQRKVNSEAKSIRAELEETILLVTTLNSSYEAHQERKKMEKEEKANAILNERVQKLSTLKMPLPDLVKLKIMTDAEFEDLLSATAELAKVEAERAEENLNAMRAKKAELLRMQEEIKKQQEELKKAQSFQKQAEIKPPTITKTSDRESFETFISHLKGLNIIPKTDAGRALNLSVNSMRDKMVAYIEAKLDTL